MIPCSFHLINSISNIFFQNNYNSMRRKTVQLDKDVPTLVRKAKKNISCHLWGRQLPNVLKPAYKKISNNYAASEAVVALLVEDLFISLQTPFREADKKQYQRLIQSSITILEEGLRNNLNPIDKVTALNERSPDAEEEPQRTINDWVCGGKLFHCEQKQSIKSKHPSILQGEKKGLLMGSASKKILPSNLSSKCLIKLPRQQYLQRKKSLQALRLQLFDAPDKHEQLLKQKLLKETMQQLANNLLKTTIKQPSERVKKLNATTTFEEYSHDYDGSVIPIKKTNNNNAISKVNVLNTTYQINSKEALVMKRGPSMLKSKAYQYFKTEMQESSKQNQKAHQDILQIIAARKQSVLKSMNDLRIYSARDDQDIELRSKFSQFAKTKAIRIRQLKN